MSKKPHVIVLKDLNLEEVDKMCGLYGGLSTATKHPATSNVTFIEQEKPVAQPTHVSFLDKSRKMVNAILYSVELNTPNPDLHCFWCRLTIPKNANPLGYPLRFIHSQAQKTLVNETTKESYCIKENICEKEIDKNKSLSYEKKGYYITDGAYCSWNCLIAQADDRLPRIQNPAIPLIYKMYCEANKVDDFDIETLHPSPSWKLLKPYGGPLTPEEYRGSFNRVVYVNKGPMCLYPYGTIYENSYRL